MTERIVDTCRLELGVDAAHRHAGERAARHGHRLAFDVRRNGLDISAREHAVARLAPVHERHFEPTIDASDTMPRIRLCNSLSKPFMTDNTTINTATASAMPIIETAEMNEIKRMTAASTQITDGDRELVGLTHGRLVVAQRARRR